MQPTKYPAINDITMVVPTKITDLGVYVNLLEYNDIEGLIILSDLSKSRFRSINRVAVVGKKFPATVFTVDEKTGNITLSKKSVLEEEAKTCETNYKNLKLVYDIVNLFIRRLEKESNIVLDITIAYQTFIWPISLDPEQQLLALRSATKDFDKIYNSKLESVDQIWTKCFQDVLATKFKDKEVLLEAVLDITCYETAGVNIIREALVKGQNLATTEYPFRIKLVKSPHYSITIKSKDQEKAATYINIAISTIKSELEQNGAIIKIVKLPEIVLDKEFEPAESDSGSDSE